MASPSEANPARPGAGVRLCALSDIADPGGKGFRFREENRMFAGFVVRVGATVTGWVDSCPHAGWPLAGWEDRYLTRDGRHILCAGHGALFNLEGQAISAPCFGQHLTPWPVELRGDEVFTI